MNVLRPLFVSLLFPFIVCNASAASAPLDLYQVNAIVTGTGEVNRGIGFALALKDVLVKVSGDPRLLDDARVNALAKRAADYVQEFSYRDRMEGIPIHDEQGSHDRPHDLTTLFVPEKIDALLATLGSRPWAGARPTLTVILDVRHAARSFLLSSDGAAGIDMRDSLANASRLVGIPVTLPSDAALLASGASEMQGNLDPVAVKRLTADAGGSYALIGSLVWSDKDLGWVADWRLAAEGRDYRWSIRGVSFDDAFRNAVRGAAQVLSGSGNPDQGDR
jgi:hypothetical protein